MNQNQCVPSWDLDDVGPIQPPPPPPAPPRAITSRSHSTGPDTSLLDYEVAELTWENGQLTMHGHGLPRVSNKSNLGGAWTEKSSTRANGTLESIVNQAITKPQPPITFLGGACEKDAGLVPCFDPCGCGVGGGAASGQDTSMSMTMDALVPTANASHNTRVGSCSTVARVPVGSEWSVSVSASESTRRREEMKGPTGDTCEIVGGELTSTSFELSPENTKIVTVDNDHDSVCHSRPQKERREEEENQNKARGKSSMSTKRSRAAAIHNQSERKRRDKINQRMKTLQKLVPNSSKTDKASMLDEVIDYLKQLQAQVQMMSRMSMPASMMMPMAAIQQQQLMMSQMGMAGMGMGMAGMGMGMGMGMSMDHINMGINPMAMARPNGAGGATILNPSTFMPSLATWDATATTTASATSGGADRLSSQHQQQQAMAPTDPYSAAFLACQSQPMTMDTYCRMAAMYQQLQQQLQQPFGP